MIVTDPIADMLTRVRNALTIKKSEVVIPASKTKNAIAEILFNEGYIEKYEHAKFQTKSMQKKIEYWAKHSQAILKVCLAMFVLGGRKNEIT